MEIKLGSNDQNTGGQVTHWQQWFKRYAKSYAPPIDGWVGNDDVAAIRILQGKLGIVVDGVFGDRTASAVGFKWKGMSQPPVVEKRRPIWIYTAPGSGAPWWIGPSFELGQRAAAILKINHQPVGYPIGGYLGFMGGDPKFSYNEVIAMQGVEFERLLDINPDVQAAMATRRNDPHARVDVELWVSGYSQSADGFEDAVERLFGDGGKYELIRDRINGLIQFGNPSTKGTGIARKVRPDWLYKLVRNINKPNDFYAIAPDEIRPAFYKIIIEAEMELPFFVHVLRIAVPVIMDWASKLLPIFGPLLGSFGPLAQIALTGVTGLQGLSGNAMFGNLMGQAAGGGDAEVDKKLIDMMTSTGLIKNIPGLISLVGALPGLQAHGMYGPADVDAAYNIMAGFRR